MSKVYVGPYGPTDAKIMLVGEAPGKEETRDGRPFVGNAGKILRKFLMSVGIDPESCYMTNMVKYQPYRNDLSGWFDNGLPNQQVLEGLVELEKEIELVKPNLIVAFGNYPMWALTGHGEWVKKTKSYGGITKYRGSVYHCQLDHGTKVIPTFHPAYIAREGMSDHGTWQADLTKIKAESEFPEIIRPEKKIIVLDGDSTYRMEQDPRHLDKYTVEPWSMTKQELREYLLEDMSKTLTIDIEYIGGNLLCVGFTTHRDEAYVLVTKTLQDIRLVKDILTSGIPLNAQNAMFEVSILEWHYNMEIMRHVKFDTMLAAHAANIELPKDLGYLTSIYTAQPYHKDMVNWNAVRRGEQDLQALWLYNGIDTWTEHEIMEEQIIHDLSDPKIERVFRHEMLLLPPLWEMSKRGIRVDVEHMQELREKLVQEIESMGNMLSAFVGEEFNVKSNKQVGELLFGRLGFKPIKMNKTGPATDDKTIAALLTKAENDQQRTVINLIRDIRQRRDLVSKFLDISFDDDNRMRGVYNPGGTTTGRLASKKFYPTGTGTNQQNIPRDTRVRSLFISDTDYEFAYADLERAESLVVAHLTNDPRMLADHAPGADAHRSLASVLFNKPEEEITKDERYMGKQTRHAGNYMQGWRTFQKNINQQANKTGVSIDAKEAKRLIGIYRDVHPFLAQWWREIEQELWRSRTLHNLLGRPRTFYGHIRSILPEAVAYTPQSTVGDVLNVGLLNVHAVEAPYIEVIEAWHQYETVARELQDLGFQALNQVHDAIGYQYPLRNRDEVNSRVRKLMSVSLMVPKTYEQFTIPVEIQIGRSWGELELYTEDLAAA